MKPVIRRLLLALALAAALAATAFAADFTHCADALQSLGLFYGTGDGYELDRAPTRDEAGAMLVRLLGAEDEAMQQQRYTAPFTDVAEWARPYVQYLYDKGLTHGTSETTFGGAEPCSAQQYAAFLLRALGYSDAAGGDFTYDTAMDFARQKGVIDLVNCDEQNFLRDDVVAMSFTALAAAPKTGEPDLLTKLVRDGAIADAKGYDGVFARYRACHAAVAADAAKAAMTVDVNMAVKMAGIPILNGSVRMNSAVDLRAAEPDASHLALQGSVNLNCLPIVANLLGLSPEQAEISHTFACYYTGGMCYTDLDGEKFARPLSLAQSVGGQIAGSDAASGFLSAVREISATADGYTLTFAGGAVNGALQSLLDSLPADLLGELALSEPAVQDLTITVTAPGGRMTSMTAALTMKAVVSGRTVSLNVDMTVSNLRTGSAVIVSLPGDLSTYQVIDPAEATK